MNSQGQYPRAFPRCLRRLSWRSIGLAAMLLLVACNGSAADEAGRAESGQVEKSTRAGPGPSAAERVGRAPACPSKSFEQFLRAFSNSGDLRIAFTAQPVKSKYPYYWKSNTEPGDPRYPKWVTEEGRGPAISKYRYDEKQEKFVRDERDLKPGQVWRGMGPDGKQGWFPIVDQFQVEQVSPTRYDVKYNGNAVDTYELRADCWYYTQHWALEPIVDCKWPDECKRRRESG